MAAKYRIPVCPHAGGVGLCELVQHLSIIDYLVVSGELDGRVAEYVDHLHEHFVDPCTVKNGAYQLPSQPGYSAEMYSTSIAAYSYPSGTYWRDSLPGQTPASSAPGPSLKAGA
jgi:L-fuconate dehydratase